MRLLLLCLAVSGLLEVHAGGRRGSYSAAGRGGGRTVGCLVLANEELFCETHAQFKLYAHISGKFHLNCHTHPILINPTDINIWSL